MELISLRTGHNYKTEKKAQKDHVGYCLFEKSEKNGL
jgi:hypothetical protein